MRTIQATVNRRLLTKASRLFTGTVCGRIIEILQNARRAGATHVDIRNRKGIVIVRDNGRGVDDFAKLLDLGGSGWEEDFEASEDPAGVGLFCLAPNELTVRSKGLIVTIPKDSWTCRPVRVRRDKQKLPARGRAIKATVGTELQFADSQWKRELVSPNAVFTGMRVCVDGVECPSQPFITGEAAEHRELGCRIQVLQQSELNQWHRQTPPTRDYGNNVLVNFHGQVISFRTRPLSNHDLAFLVDMSGAPTGIRLMLPARTCLVENPALGQLKATMEKEAFLYLKRQGQHRLYFQDYQRARALGIELPEAQPAYRAGLLFADMGPEPVEVLMPEGQKLDRCYRMGGGEALDQIAEANVHLLAALGTHAEPFVPVTIDCRYDGYSWAKLPTVDRVELKVGRTLQESRITGGLLICVASLEIAAHASDGKVFRSAVCMAEKPWDGKGPRNWWDDVQVYVTREASRHLGDSQIWFHFGGFNDNGDSYDTQEYEFGRELDEFWRRLMGPYEPLRAALMEALRDLPKGWRSVKVLPTGRVTIQEASGGTRRLDPPKKGAESTTQGAKEAQS